MPIVHPLYCIYSSWSHGHNQCLWLACKACSAGKDLMTSAATWWSVNTHNRLPTLYIHTNTVHATLNNTKDRHAGYAKVM